MKKIQNFLDFLLTKKVIKKLSAYLLLIIILLILKHFIPLFLLIFIFSYLFFSLATFLKKNLDKISFFQKYIPLNVYLVFIYIFFFIFLLFSVGRILPMLTRELSELPKHIPFVADYLYQISGRLEEITLLNNEIGLTIEEIAQSGEYDVVLQIFEKFKSFGSIFFQFILSLVLSFIFIIDRDKLSKYLGKIQTSNFSFLYEEYQHIFGRIVKSFGTIIQAQSIIALVNAVLTTIGLFIIGGVYGEAFPYLLTITLVVFIFGFVPVLGFIISSIPIIILAYSFVGGMPAVISVVCLIVLVHIIEAYYLNPKIVSSFIELPVSLTFLILVISEHLFGMAGLLIGVSAFYFLMGLVTDFDAHLSDKKVLKKKRKSPIKKRLIAKK